MSNTKVGIVISVNQVRCEYCGILQERIDKCSIVLWRHSLDIEIIKWLVESTYYSYGKCLCSVDNTIDTKRIDRECVTEIKGSFGCAGCRIYNYVKQRIA